MSYHMEKLPDEPIVIHVYNADYSFSAESDADISDIFALLDAQNSPVCMIYDLRAASITFNDVLYAMSSGVKQRQILKHPNIRETVLVTNKSFIKAAAEAMSNPVFGGDRIRVLDTVEAVLAYVRSQLPPTHS